MKKITLLMLFLSTLWGYSQVKNYTWAQSNGTYNEIAGNLLGSTSTDNERFVDSTAAGAAGSKTVLKGLGLPIGFKFKFNGYDYDRFAINANGWISLGSSALNPNAVDITLTTYQGFTTPISTQSSVVPADLSARISALGADLKAQSTSTLSYQTSGVKGSRVLVVQWKNYKRSLGTATESFNFQIRLNEGSNTVDFVYGPFNFTDYSTTFEVGLRADIASPANNYVNRKGITTTSWSNTAAGATAADVVYLNGKSSPVVVPASGLTFTWTPPGCSYPNSLVTSGITATNATLTWGFNPPMPSGYEYVVSTDTALPTGSGTAVTNSTATVSNLNANTAYNVFLRSSCSAGFSSWLLAGNFKTKCIVYDTFSENFDGYTNLFGNATVPDCWSNGGTSGRTFITNGITSQGSAPNSLKLYTGSGTTMAYATLPAVTNLNLNTNRLRFKTYSITAGNKLDIGYFDSAGTTFLPITQIDVPSTMKEFIVLPGTLPDYAKNLVFRNSITGSEVYIDDVFWEVKPPCSNVNAVTVNGVLNNSVNLSWSQTGTETQWQYAYGPSSLTDLTSLTPVTVTSKSVVVKGLMPSTSYKIWVRSNCDQDLYGIWMPSNTFVTTCDPISILHENFDAQLAFPDCWNKVGSGGTAQVMSPPSASSSPNALRISSYLPTSRAVVALPPLNNAGAATHRLRFKYSGDKVGAKLEIGYLTEASDAATFVPLTNCTVASTTAYDYNIVALGIVPTTPYLALRNSGEVSGGSTIYVDDLFWEPIPTCPDISAVALSGVTHNSVNVSWTAGGVENMWQYALGTSADADPSKLTPVDVDSSAITIQQGISPSTTYKVWIRSKCGDSSIGAWFGPYLFTTTCAPVTDFTQNFDNTTDFPACWSKVGAQGKAAVTASVGSASTNGLKLDSTIDAKAVVAMQPVSNSGDSTHRLKFKLSGSLSGAVVEVGYLMNYTDPSSFMPLQSFTVNSDLSYSNVTAELGFEPASQVLAFRNPAMANYVDHGNAWDSASTIYIDDVIWEELPPCTDISDLKTKSVRENSADITWTAGGMESKWQYVLGTSAQDPNTLAPVDVASVPTTINNLDPLTTYKVWVRSKCNKVTLGTWIPVVFTTTCAAVTEFSQNFDGGNALPNCWNDINAKGAVSVVSSAGTSSPNVLRLNSAATGTIASMQPVSNAALGTHRLKFKFKGSAVGADLQVGYLTNVSDPTSFVLIEGLQASSTSLYDSKIMILGDAPQSEVLAFRNPAGSTATVYIDDVVWEAIPACSDISTLKAIAINSHSVDVIWKAVGSESKAQYVIAPSSVAAPDGLNPVDIDGYAMQIAGLAPATSYKVWMRTKCNDVAFGYWSEPLIFSTTCATVAEFTQNFDLGTTLPSCWNQIGNQGLVSVINLSGSNVLRMNSTTSIVPVVVAMPPVSNSGDASHRLKFKLAGNATGASVEVGYLTNITNADSFVPVKSFTASSNIAFDNIVTELGLNPTSEFLAFRNPGSVNCSVFIDEVIWEAIPPCADVSNITSTAVTSNSVDLNWKPGASENKWQYALGDSTSNDPNLLTAIDVDSSVITINKLTPTTSYKVWIRSKCATASVGVWVGPLSFMTTCAPISDFTENFDAAYALPACWGKVGASGTVTVAPATGTGYSKVLNMSSNGTADPVIVAMLPVDNAGTGTHRLRFQLSGSVAGAVAEVGYLTNVADPSSFVKLKTFTVNSANVYDNVVAALGTNPTSQILAFRNPGIASSSSVYIENVIWETAPSCPDVNSLATKSISANSVDLTWDSSDVAKKWQYAIGSATATNPDILDHVNVDTSAITISGLVSSSVYKVWVRSMCSDTSFGQWTTNPLVFTTTCNTVSEFNQNFDASTALPACWTKIGAPAIFPVVAMGGSSYPNVLYMKNTAVGEQVIMTLPPVSNAGAGTHRLRFRLSGYAVGNTVELGYMTNVTDAASFVPLQSFAVSSASMYEMKIAELGTTPASPILAFRNPNVSLANSGVYIDDAIWEPIPACSPVSGLTYKSVTNNSVNLKWNAASETHWQYVLASATATDPNQSTPVDVDSADIVVEKLTGNSSYKVWVRSKCDTALFGGWTEAIVFKTICDPVTELTENFETSANLPSCWSKVGTKGQAFIMSTTAAPSGSHLLYMNNSSATVTDVLPVVALPKLSNIGDGTHRLRFKFQSNFAGLGVEVGYLTDISDPASFVLIKGFGSAVANIFETGVLELDGSPLSQVLAFRFPGTSQAPSLYIDDVTWELRPVVSVPNDEFSDAVALTVGTSFDSNAIIGTNVTATGTNQVIQPGCGGYNGGDVWYSAVVPASGNIIFEIMGVPGGLTNTAIAVYGDYTNYMNLVACADSSTDHPKITLMGRKSGEVLYLRVWENGGDVSGAFKVSAYDPANSILGSDIFDSVNFSYYPNPVKDVLNLSFNQEINDVTVVNLLGQQVISKSVNANQDKIDMSGLPVGTYLVKVTAGTQLKTIKVVKE